MVVFFISIGQIQVNDNSNWTLLMLGSIAVGFVAFLALLASIPQSKSRYGIITLLTFLLFFGVLFNFDTFANTFGMNSKSQDKAPSVSDTANETADPTPTSTPTKQPTKQPSQANNVNSAQANKVQCIGPDGKQFDTTMEECKNLNEKWGKPVDYILNCNIHPDCGGGVVRMSKSQCESPCSGLDKKTSNNSQDNSVTKPSYANKIAVYLTSWNTTYYCPSEFVDGVKTADSHYKTAFETKRSCDSETSSSILNCKNPCFNLYYPDQKQIDSCKQSCDDLNKYSYDYCQNEFDRVSDSFMNIIKNCTSYQ